MIASYRHKGLKRLAEEGDGSKLRQDLVQKIGRVLSVLDAASTPQALDLPGYRLHALKGDLQGYWSVTVRANWRIIFRFENGDAYEVDLVDYH